MSKAAGKGKAHDAAVETEGAEETDKARSARAHTEHQIAVLEERLERVEERTESIIARAKARADKIRERIAALEADLEEALEAAAEEG